MREIVKMIYGSRLYGLHTEKSDTDYKGIYMPELRDYLLCRVEGSINNTTGPKDAKNSAEDVDHEMYSLNRFVDLACAGETVALDMLYAPASAIIDYPPRDIWFFLVANRQKFLTKNMKAYIGYVKTQAYKYGMKGSNLKRLETIIEALEATYRHSIDLANLRLRDIWARLPEMDHVHKIEQLKTDKDGHDQVFYEVNGKKYQDTLPVSEVLASLKKTASSYGKRAQAAKDNDGADWKALSHAFRVVYQMEGLYRDGEFSFPLPQTEHIMDIKNGKIPFEDVGPELVELVENVELLAEKSSYPEVIDRAWWDEWLFQTVKSNV